ncbi:MAG: dephospho-CoA kinase [Thalassotalea sp.]|nr:dephospho-CoA kinase [Thalassotalea sp.]
MAKYIVGLTGGIGSGKTTVSNMFAELGVEVIDADIVARQVVAPNSEALVKIVEHFGQDILNKNGELNRGTLRSKIFSNENEKQWLNALLHPLIRQNILNELALASGDYCILSAPLLLENNLQALVNRVLVVDISVATQLSRTCQRDSSNQQEVNAIINSQISREKRLTFADDIINNESSDLNEVITQVNALNKSYKTYANTASVS